MDGNGHEIRIVIADDQVMLREALRELLEHEEDFRVIGEASNGLNAIEQVNALGPDILLLDLTMPHLSGIEALRRLAKGPVQVRTILFNDTSVDSSLTIEALKLGARGVVPRNAGAPLLFKSIRAVASGEVWVGHQIIADLLNCLRSVAEVQPEPENSNGYHLTRREMEIVASIVEGCTNKEISKRFSISEQTVKHHLTSIFEKVGVTNRLELALMAMRKSLAA